jgi:hypothetical protein
MNIPDTAKIAPKFHNVPTEDVELLIADHDTHADLIAFWNVNGAGDFNLTPDGKRFNEMMSNRLLDAEDIADLINGGDPNILSLLRYGIPFFNTLDRDYILIAANGEIIEITASGDRRVVSNSLDDFIQQLLTDPTFYESR